MRLKKNVRKIEAQAARADKAAGHSRIGVQ
jgi:hypothetical protein